MSLYRVGKRGIEPRPPSPRPGALPLRNFPVVRPTWPRGTPLATASALGQGRGRSSHNPHPALFPAPQPCHRPAHRELEQRVVPVRALGLAPARQVTDGQPGDQPGRGCLATARYVERRGLEPLTCRLRGGCSTRLSYFPRRHFAGRGSGRPEPGRFCRRSPAVRPPCARPRVTRDLAGDLSLRETSPEDGRGACEIRTRGLLPARQARYQLRQGPNWRAVLQSCVADHQDGPLSARGGGDANAPWAARAM